MAFAGGGLNRPSTRDSAPGPRFFFFAVVSVVLMYYDQRDGWSSNVRYVLQAAAYPVQVAVGSPRKFWNGMAGNLSGGQKQMLAISRAIVEPRKLLLVDEPTKGLAPAIIGAMIEAFRELKRDTTLLVVEQNFHFARELGDAVAVMDAGRIVHRGTMAALAADEALQGRLLGLSLESHQ